MARDMFMDVLDFHAKFCPHRIGSQPKDPGWESFQLRGRLIKEEIKELFDAMYAQDIPEVADAIADSIFVLLGCAITYGIDMRPVWEEVCRTNMLKVGGSTRDDGKVLKPEGWEPPDIQGVLDVQGSLLDLVQEPINDEG